MKLIHLLILLSTMLCLACQDDNSPIITEDPPPVIVAERCVDFEEATSEDTGYLVFDKGQQEEGSASGIKINKEWDASPELIIDSTDFRIVNRTFWRGIIDGYDYGEFLTLAELLRLFDMPTDIPIGCYSLDDNETNIDQNYIRCSYSLHHGDTWIARYQLDPTADNQIEIIESNQEQGVFKAKLAASFFTDENPGLPEYPNSLRFFNVDIAIGGE